MRAGLGAVVLAGTAVLAVYLGAGSPVAATATTWTVRPGGSITAAATKATLTDTTTGVPLRCSPARMSGTLKTGSGLPGTGVGAITTAAFQCAGPVGWPNLTTRGLPWRLTLVSYDAGTGVSRGTLGHLKFVLTGPACTAVVNGTNGTAADGVVAVRYANATGKLKILPGGGNLHWWHVSGCAGLVGNGDPATLSAAFAVSPPQTITSP